MPAHPHLRTRLCFEFSRSRSPPSSVPFTRRGSVHCLLGHGSTPPVSHTSVGSLFLWPFKHHGTSVTVLATHPPLPALPRRHHLKPAFGSTSPPLPRGAPYTSNTLPARDCKTPLGYGYSIATFEPSLPRPPWVPRLGFSLCWPALPYRLPDRLYHGRILPPSVYLPHLSLGEYPPIPRSPQLRLALSTFHLPSRGPTFRACRLVPAPLPFGFSFLSPCTYLTDLVLHHGGV